MNQYSRELLAEAASGTGDPVPLVYALHSGNLYGTERMALATAGCLSGSFSPFILAPPGPAIDEAKRLGFGAAAFSSIADFARALRRVLCEHEEIGFVATGLTHSLACLALNAAYRRRVRHLHVVHGGASERESYGRKHLLNWAPVRFVAVSDFVRERLLAHGVRESRITVIENFLPAERLQQIPRRPPFSHSGVRRLLVISRLDPAKRVDLLLDAIEMDPRLRSLPVRILGRGWDEDTLRRRAAIRKLDVRFIGFEPDVGKELVAADLLVHLCPTEPFGLAILEAMAAGVPVLVPDRGGAGSLVEDERTGFRFAADNAAALALRLADLRSAAPTTLNRIAVAARASLDNRFAARERSAEYERLLLGKGRRSSDRIGTPIRESMRRASYGSL